MEPMESDDDPVDPEDLFDEMQEQYAKDMTQG